MVRDADGTGVRTRSPGSALRVLGGFTATVGDDAVNLGGPRQRGVLARILIGEAEAVSAEQVLHDVWGERAAEATVGAVQAYVSRLRRLFGPDALPRHGHGYVLDRDVVAVDADLFVADVDAGRRALARGNDEDAAALLEVALARWTGPCAFGVGAQGQMPFLAPYAARLEEMRVVATEALADAHARQGRAADDVALLEELAARDPLRESVAVQLVRALYAAGRQADALAAYDRCRGALADELGVEPTPALRQVRAAVLAHEPLPGVGGTVLPTHLPPRNRTFVGRRGLLAAVDATLDDDTRRPRAVALTGLGGVGKTELALELAHLRHRHGRVAWWISAEDPAGTATGLAALAAALGIAPFERREDARAALWAELDRTPGWLLVYDNADEPAQLEPFLPAARHGDVIITSRNPAWRRIAHPVAVGPLARGESLAYVATRTGDRPVEADTLAELLGDLPLALEQACAYIEQTRISLPDYVDLFRRHRDGLLLRDVEGSGRTVATTWGLAFDRLAARAPRGGGTAGDDRVPRPGRDLGRHAGPVRAGRAGAAGGAARAAAAVAGRPRVRHGAGAPAGAGRRAGPDDRGRAPRSARRGGARPASRRPRRAQRSGRDVPDDLAAHLVCLAGHGEALGAEPDGLVDALERVAARQAERALYPAAEHVLRAALRLHDRAHGVSRGARAADLRARSGPRRRGPARARAGAAPRGGRAAGGDRRPGRRRARPRLQPARARAELRGRRSGGHRRPPARAGGAAPGRPGGPGAGGAHRPRLHAVEHRRARRRGRGVALGPRDARGAGPQRRARLGARDLGPGHGRAGRGPAGRGGRAPTRGDHGLHPGRGRGPPRHRPGVRQARLRPAPAGPRRRGHRGAPARRRPARAGARAGRLARRHGADEPRPGAGRRRNRRTGPSASRPAPGRSSRGRWATPTPARCWPPSGSPTRWPPQGSRSARGRSEPRPPNGPTSRSRPGRADSCHRRSTTRVPRSLQEGCKRAGRQ